MDNTKMTRLLLFSMILYLIGTAYSKTKRRSHYANKNGRHFRHGSKDVKNINSSRRDNISPKYKQFLQNEVHTIDRIMETLQQKISPQKQQERVAILRNNVNKYGSRKGKQENSKKLKINEYIPLKTSKLMNTKGMQRTLDANSKTLLKTKDISSIFQNMSMDPLTIVQELSSSDNLKTSFQKSYAERKINNVFNATSIQNNNRNTMNKTTMNKLNNSTHNTEQNTTVKSIQQQQNMSVDSIKEYKTKTQAPNSTAVPLENTVFDIENNLDETMLKNNKLTGQKHDQNETLINNKQDQNKTSTNKKQHQNETLINKIQDQNQTLINKIQKKIQTTKPKLKTSKVEVSSKANSLKLAKSSKPDIVYQNQLNPINSDISSNQYDNMLNQYGSVVNQPYGVQYTSPYNAFQGLQQGYQPFKSDVLQGKDYSYLTLPSTAYSTDNRDKVLKDAQIYQQPTLNFNPRPKTNIYINKAAEGSETKTRPSVGMFIKDVDSDVNVKSVNKTRQNNFATLKNNTSQAVKNETKKKIKINSVHLPTLKHNTSQAVKIKNETKKKIKISTDYAKKNKSETFHKDVVDRNLKNDKKSQKKLTSSTANQIIKNLSTLESISNENSFTDSISEFNMQKKRHHKKKNGSGWMEVKLNEDEAIHHSIDSNLLGKKSETNLMHLVNESSDFLENKNVTEFNQGTKSQTSNETLEKVETKFNDDNSEDDADDEDDENDDVTKEKTIKTEKSLNQSENNKKNGTAIKSTTDNNKNTELINNSKNTELINDSKIVNELADNSKMSDSKFTKDNSSALNESKVQYNTPSERLEPTGAFANYHLLSYSNDTDDLYDDADAGFVNKKQQQNDTVDLKHDQTAETADLKNGQKNDRVDLKDGQKIVDTEEHQQSGDGENFKMTDIDVDDQLINDTINLEGSQQIDKTDHRENVNNESNDQKESFKMTENKDNDQQKNGTVDSNLKDDGQLEDGSSLKLLQTMCKEVLNSDNININNSCRTSIKGLIDDHDADDGKIKGDADVNLSVEKGNTSFKGKFVNETDDDGIADSANKESNFQTETDTSTPSTSNTTNTTYESDENNADHDDDIDDDTAVQNSTISASIINDFKNTTKVIDNIDSKLNSSVALEKTLSGRNKSQDTMGSRLDGNKTKSIKKNVDTISMVNDDDDDDEDDDDDDDDDVNEREIKGKSSFSSNAMHGNVHQTSTDVLNVNENKTDVTIIEGRDIDSDKNSSKKDGYKLHYDIYTNEMIGNNKSMTSPVASDVQGVKQDLSNYNNRSSKGFENVKTNHEQLTEQNIKTMIETNQPLDVNTKKNKYRSKNIDILPHYHKPLKISAIITNDGNIHFLTKGKLKKQHLLSHKRHNKHGGKYSIGGTGRPNDVIGTVVPIGFKENQRIDESSKDNNSFNSKRENARDSTFLPSAFNVNNTSLSNDQSVRKTSKETPMDVNDTSESVAEFNKTTTKFVNNKTSNDYINEDNDISAFSNDKLHHPSGVDVPQIHKENTHAAHKDVSKVQKYIHKYKYLELPKKYEAIVLRNKIQKQPS